MPATLPYLLEVPYCILFCVSDSSREACASNGKDKNIQLINEIIFRCSILWWALLCHRICFQLGARYACVVFRFPLAALNPSLNWYLHTNFRRPREAAAPRCWQSSSGFVSCERPKGYGTAGYRFEPGRVYGLAAMTYILHPGYLVSSLYCNCPADAVWGEF